MSTPQWEEISWEEALETVTARLDKVRKEDPRKLVIAHFDMPGYGISKASVPRLARPTCIGIARTTAVQRPHVANLLLNGSFNGELDFERCRHMVLWGTQLGAIVETIPLHSANKMAEARANGAKLVVIDPFCGNAAAKADEWVPLKPGTDGVLALAMLNALVNDLGLYDAEFLKVVDQRTVSGRRRRRYVRDEATGKPQIWDAAAGQARVFDAPELSEPALEGEYQVGGKTARPSFQVLKEHLKQFTVPRRNASPRYRPRRSQAREGLRRSRQHR